MLSYTQGWSTRSVSFQGLQGLITKNIGRSRSISLELYEGKRTTLKGNRYTKIRWFYGLILIIWILSAFVTPTSLFGEETDKKSEEESKSKSNFVITIKDNLISLDAKDASLVDIVEEIGSRMKIDVITKIPEEKKITTKFSKLPLEAAIERLREYADIVYIKDSEEEKIKITKILVFPKGKGEELSKPIKEEESAESDIGKKEEETAKETPRSEPFKFEFDPSEFEEGK